MEKILTKIEKYWTKRAPSYTDVVKENMNNGWEEVWAKEMIAHFPKKEGVLKILDIGTGPGFYALMLAKRGFHVTAIDYSEGMLAEAKKNVGEWADKINFQKMDAHSLDFENESFDVIVTRNLTWNLIQPQKAYQDWKRVLVKGGVMLNFDANWYSYLFDKEKEEAYLEDRKNAQNHQLKDHNAYEESSLMEKISLDLPLSKKNRPEWDVTVLTDMGFEMVYTDENIGERVWREEEKINYASTPGFLIKAVK